MKIVKILSAFAAVCALVIGCAKEGPTVLKEIQVSSSYVGIPTSGGSKTITVTATDSWSINEIPKWLSISPSSGSAGETAVTFSADKALSNNENTIKIVCAGKEQSIIVKQLAEQVELKPISVAEALEVCKQFPDGSQVRRVKGVVCRIQELDTGQYGNATFFLSDDGTYGKDNWLEVYRAYWFEGKKFTDPNAFAVGDELVIEGNLMIYGGTTPETVQYTAFVVEHNPSLIKCDSLVFEGMKLTEALPIEGATFNAELACKGDGVSVTIPDDAKSWLSVNGIQTAGDKATVFFAAAKNNGGDRGTTLTFTTTKDGKSYTAQATVEQKGAIIDATVEEFNAAEVGTTVYRVGGIVTKIDNASQGNFHFKDYSGETYAYKVTNFADYSTLKVGDIVTITGTRGQYNSTIELMNGKIEEVKTVTAITAAEVTALADDDKDDPKNYVMITGKVTDGRTSFPNHKFDLVNYGNFDLVDESGSAYVYGVTTGWKGAKGNGAFATLGVKEGDTITIVAYKSSYGSEAQLVGMYLSHKSASSVAGPYDITVDYTLGASAYDDGAAAVNGTEVAKTIKIGTSSKQGDFSVAIPSGCTKLSFYAVAWNGSTDAVVEIYDGETLAASQSVAGNEGATGNAPYTITVADTDKYSLNVPAGKTVKVTSNKRVIFFGIKAE